MFGLRSKPFIPWVTATIALIAVAVVSVHSIMGRDAFLWICAYACHVRPDFLIDFNDPHWVGISGYLLRLFLHPLVHDGWTFLAYNCFPLLVYGWFVERHFVETGLGRWRYAVFAWTLAVLAAVVVSIYSSVNSLPFLASRGMSGMVMGISGAFFAARVRAPFWLKVALAMETLEAVNGDVARIYDDRKLSAIAHMIGFIAGILLGMATRLWTRSRGRGGMKVAVGRRIAGAAGYIFLPAAFITLLVRRGRGFPRFHALQSVGVWLVLAFLLTVAVKMPRIYMYEMDLKFLSEAFMVNLILVVLPALAVKAFAGEAFALPMIGRLAGGAAEKPEERICA